MAGGGGAQPNRSGLSSPGTRITLVYMRDGREATTALNVEVLSTDPVQLGATSLQAYGANVRDTRPSDGISAPGALVVAVEGGSTAAQQDLRAGDLITAANGMSVTGFAELARALSSTAGAALTVQRGDESVEIVLAAAD